VSGLAAIILAGGRSRRMGQDKAAIRWGARTAVERLARLARAAGARKVIVSGGDYGLTFVQDPIAFGGPVGGLLAAASSVGDAERILVLAVDAPTLCVDDLQPLLAAAGTGAAYLAYPLPMVVATAAIPRDLAPDTPLRRFVDLAGLNELTPPPDARARLRGANTVEELQDLRRADRLQVAGELRSDQIGPALRPFRHGADRAATPSPLRGAGVQKGKFLTRLFAGEGDRRRSRWWRGRRAAINLIGNPLW